MPKNNMNFTQFTSERPRIVIWFVRLANFITPWAWYVRGIFFCSRCACLQFLTVAQCISPNQWKVSNEWRKLLIKPRVQYGAFFINGASFYSLTSFCLSHDWCLAIHVAEKRRRKIIKWKLFAFFWFKASNFKVEYKVNEKRKKSSKENAQKQQKQQPLHATTKNRVSNCENKNLVS